MSSVEVELGGDRVYTTALVPKDEASNYGARGSASAKVDDFQAYNPELFRLTIPQVSASRPVSSLVFVLKFRSCAWTGCTSLFGKCRVVTARSLCS